MKQSLQSVSNGDPVNGSPLAFSNISKLTYERRFYAENANALLCGVDEAGRGCLAGPVVAGAVLMTLEEAESLYRNDLAAVNDSKQLTERERERLFSILVEKCQTVATGMASPQEIDRRDILQATHLAMRRAIENLREKPDFALVDGLPVKGLPVNHLAIVRGDSKSFLVACASILAKVTRDRILTQLDLKYPEYGFAKHKGYGTLAHREALKKFGASPEHRMTFRPVADLFNQLPGFE